MDRLLRLGGAMPGLSQGPPPSDAPVVDTAEQVEFIGFNSLFQWIILFQFLFHNKILCFVNYLRKKLQYVNSTFCIY